MTITLIILAVAAIFFMMGKIRSDIVGLCALLSLMLLNILTPEEALSGFSNPIVIMMISVFVVGGGIFKTGLASMVSRKILVLAGESQNKLFILIMLVTATIGAFVSNTGTVALMLPIVVNMAQSARMSPSRFLMPLAFASSMGGMLTLIGNPSNLVINSTLISSGHGSLSFFSFFPVGVVCVILGIIILIPLSKLLVIGKKQQGAQQAAAGKSLRQLASEYQIAQNLYRVTVHADSPMTGKALCELKIPQKYHVSIVEIRRKSVEKAPFSFSKKGLHQQIAEHDSVIEAHDTLYVMGAFDKIQAFAAENKLALIDADVREKSHSSLAKELRFNEIGIAEVVILSRSKLINRKVAESQFREKYHISILGIQRNDQYLLQNLKDEKILAGDALLVQGSWKNIALMSAEQAEWIVVGQPLVEASRLTLDHKAPLAALILVSMVLAMATGIIPTVAAVMLAALAMVFSGCFSNVEEAYKTINWESVVLVGAMLPMSLAIEKTGGTTLMADSLAYSLGGYGPMLLLAVIYFATSAMTMLISNTATAVLFAPIALQAATGMGVSPYPFLFAVTVGASMCFASPFSTPPNAIVMSAGRYTFMDYIKVGAPLQIIFGLVMIFVLPLIFPF